MTDPNEHPAKAAEQEVVADAQELTKQQADSEAQTDDEDTAHETDHPEPHLERLQKILAQAGIASRRHAEELITAGRVQVNGQVVNVLGAKADAARDHIRVDGKLLQGAERLRYFQLNKPRGHVTTVSDPEGRPTVMEFFSRLGERLYPVGRLDFQSEGLLLVTNDGELANSLTRAASGVEKTYLVKVAGQPTEEKLERLRTGVSIDKGHRGDGKVRTAPARIKLLRPGQNPWFEVVLTEGRNRELRKMFEEIGHHVEKIRRVGYGPLVLDVEPGKIRELTPEEVEALRMTAAGKLKPKRVKSTFMLPKEAGLTTEEREQKKAGKLFRKKPFGEKKDFGGRKEFDPKRAFRSDKPAGRSFGERKLPDRRGPARDDSSAIDYPLPSRRPAGGSFKPRPGGDFKPRAGGSFKPRSDRPARGGRSSGEGFKPRPGGDFKPRTGAPARGRGDFSPRSPRPAGEGFKPRFDRPERSARPANEGFKSKPGGTFKPRTGGDFKPRSGAPSRNPRPAGEGFKPRTDRPVRSARPAGEGFKPRPAGSFKPRSEGDFKPRGGARPAAGSGRPRRGPGSSRPFTTSSGIPRPGGARPSSKPGRSAGKGSFGDKPKTGGKPFGSKPGGFKKTGGFKNGPNKGPGFKGKTGGFKPKPGGGKPPRRSGPRGQR